MGGLGGGIGYCGDTCGCLTGSACAIGYFLGNLAPEEKEDAQMKPAVQELYQWFHKKTEEEFWCFFFIVRISLLFGLGSDYGAMSCADCRYLYESDRNTDRTGNIGTMITLGKTKKCMPDMYESTYGKKMYW